jgi:hypothetical protein
MTPRRILLFSLLALSAPAAALEARAQWGAPANQPAYREGYDRGVRAGNDDLRRGDTFNFTDEGDYRDADAGYRREYGRIDSYRSDFRRGYQDGYRIGYNPSRYGGSGVPPWSNGRGYARGRSGAGPNGNAYRRYDLAVSNGYSDGYDAGVDDGRDRRRNDPIGESRYRNGDHGYEREYGPREDYKLRYRDAFRQGYLDGYRDGQGNWYR